jgi:hypothetical protein
VFAGDELSRFTLAERTGDAAFAGLFPTALFLAAMIAADETGRG